MGTGFEAAIKLALNHADFPETRTHEYGVLVFNSAPWTQHAEAAETLLDASEKHRASRFRFDHDRNAYVLAHAYWRVVLGIYLGIETATVPLLMAPAGQPTLPGTGVATSLSHSGSWVAVAIGKTSTIGVDIEDVTNRVALDQLVSTICTQGEIDDLEKCPPIARQAAVLALWTRKEALLKAFGIGLRVEPSSVSANPGEIVIPPRSAPVQTPCQVRTIALPGNLVGALATPLENKYPWRLYLHESQAMDSVIIPA